MGAEGSGGETAAGGGAPGGCRRGRGGQAEHRRGQGIQLTVARGGRGVRPALAPVRRADWPSPCSRRTRSLAVPLLPWTSDRRGRGDLAGLHRRRRGAHPSPRRPNLATDKEFSRRSLAADEWIGPPLVCDGQGVWLALACRGLVTAADAGTWPASLVADEELIRPPRRPNLAADKDFGRPLLAADEVFGQPLPTTDKWIGPPLAHGGQGVWLALARRGQVTATDAGNWRTSIAANEELVRPPLSTDVRFGTARRHGGRVARLSPCSRRTRTFADPCSR